MDALTMGATNDIYSDDANLLQQLEQFLISFRVVVRMVLTTSVNVQHEISGGGTKTDSQEVEFVAVAFDEFSTGKSIFPVSAPFWFESIFGGNEVKPNVEYVGKFGMKF